MKVNTFTTMEDQLILTAINERPGCKVARGTLQALVELFADSHTKSAIMSRTWHLRKLHNLPLRKWPVTPTAKQSLLQGLKSAKKLDYKEGLIPKGPLPADDDDYLPEPSNSIGKVCRLGRAVAQSVEMFMKALDEFKTEYEENMELLRKTTKLRQAVEDFKLAASKRKE